MITELLIYELGKEAFEAGKSPFELPTGLASQVDVDPAILSLLAPLLKAHWEGWASAQRSETTKAGLARCRAQGTKLGRPRAHVDVERARELRAQGLSFRKIALQLGVSQSAIYRSLKSAPHFPAPEA